MIDTSEKNKDLVARIKEKGSKKSSDAAKASDITYFWTWAHFSFGLEESYPIKLDVLINFIVTHLEGDFPGGVEELLIESKMKSKKGPHKLKTIKRRVSSLSWQHKEFGFIGENNTALHYEVSSLIRFAANDPDHRSKPALAATKNIIVDVFNSIDNKTSAKNYNISVRDKALIAVGWSAGRRRSEVNSLMIENISIINDDYYIFKLFDFKTSKNSDSFLEFKIEGIAKVFLDLWLDVSEIKTGRLFRRVYKSGRISNSCISDTQIYRIVKKRFLEANIPHSEYISPHSLRSGFITELGKQGGNVGDGMAVTGHRSLSTFMNYYQSGLAETNSVTNLLSVDNKNSKN